MKKLILLLLLLGTAFPIKIEKQVYGASLLDINESLLVEINITSDEPIKVLTLTDPIPEHFVAVDYPSACKQSEKALVCDLGQILKGSMNIRYKLVAISTGMGVIGFPMLTYEGGIATSAFSKQYAIGKPKISVQIEGKNAFLPGEEILQEITIKNTGIMAANDVKIKIKAGDMEKNYTLNLNPEEVKKIKINAGKAEKSGGIELNVYVFWNNKSVEEKKQIIFISPDIEARRSVKVMWKVEGKELVPKVKDTLYIRNNGTAPGNYSLSTGETFYLKPGESKIITKEYEEKAPAVKISLRDSRGVLYATISFKEEKPEARKTFLVILYQYVANQIPFAPLILTALLSLYLAAKIKIDIARVALLTIFVVSSLLAASYFAVGAAPQLFYQILSKSSALIPLPHI